MTSIEVSQPNSFLSARRALKLSQAEVKARVPFAISQPTLSRIESSAKFPTTATARKLAQWYEAAGVWEGRALLDLVDRGDRADHHHRGTCKDTDYTSPYKSQDPRQFYLDSTDSRGHSTKKSVAFPPETASLIEMVVNDPLTPYRSVYDFARDAIVHRLRQLLDQSLITEPVGERAKLALVEASWNDWKMLEGDRERLLGSLAEDAEKVRGRGALVELGKRLQAVHAAIREEDRGRVESAMRVVAKRLRDGEGIGEDAGDKAALAALEAMIGEDEGES